MTGKPSNGQAAPYLVHVTFDPCDHTRTYKCQVRPRVGDWKACATCGQLRRVVGVQEIYKPVRDDANS
jgi:hypothetical protein